MGLAEPTPETFSSTLLASLWAPRPPFLLAAVMPMLVGLAWTVHTGHPLHPVTALATLLAGVTLNAAINLLNDCYDDLNGCDRLNEERIHPFTGGSRFIQNGVLSRRQMFTLALAMLFVTLALGLWLSSRAGATLLGLGLSGLLLGWGYSAPPLKLNSRGLGELAVLAGFGLLPLGAFLVQTGELSPGLLLVSLPVGMLSAGLLYINQFPDRRADILAGKLNLVARLEPRVARWGYPLLIGGAVAIHLVLVYRGLLPSRALIALSPLLLTLQAGRVLFRHCDEPQRLAPALPLTIAAVLGYGLLLALVLFLD